MSCKRLLKVTINVLRMYIEIEKLLMGVFINNYAILFTSILHSTTIVANQFILGVELQCCRGTIKYLHS